MHRGTMRPKWVRAAPRMQSSSFFPLLFFSSVKVGTIGAWERKKKKIMNSVTKCSHVITPEIFSFTPAVLVGHESYRKKVLRFTD